MLRVTAVLCYSYLLPTDLSYLVFRPAHHDLALLARQTKNTQDVLPNIRHVGLSSSLLGANSDEASGSAEVAVVSLSGPAIPEHHGRDELPALQVPAVAPLPPTLAPAGAQHEPPVPGEAPGDLQPPHSPPAPLAVSPEALPILPPVPASSSLPATEEISVQVLW